MALTRITKGVIKPNENYDTHNINSTGIVTAIGLDINGNADISGNLSVGGVLTYEDVTSIDSVGVITARQGIHVGAGVSAIGIGTFKGGLDVDGNGDISGNLDIHGDLDVDGHTNLDNVSVAGVTTITSTTYPLVVHADTGYQGILVNGNNAPTIGFNIGNNATPSWKLGLHGNSHLNFALSTGTGNSNKLVIQDASNGGKGIFYGDWHGTNLSMAGSLYHDADDDTQLQFGGSEDVINLRTGGSTRLSVQNSGLVITGVTTFSASAHVSNASGSVFFGAGNDTAYGIQGGIGRAGGANYHIGSSAVGDLCIAAEGSKRILFGTKTGTGIGGITKRMSIASNGQVTIDGNLDAVGGIDATANSTFAGDIDVDGHTNLDNVSIAGVTTFSTSPVVPNGTYYKGVINSGSQQKIVGGYISGSNTLRLGESMYLTMNPERLGLGISDPQRTLHLSSNNTVIALTDTAAGTNQKTKYILSDAGVFAIGKLSDDYNTATEHLYIDNNGLVIINRNGYGTADVNA
ncbi:MAG: hypothetical protein VXY93_09930, partial [Pseudomonadota bacterium]|nr:hypothetical protein [Pseudomonadota bacterium]